MPNMARIIKSHNAKLLSQNNSQPIQRCNCQRRAGQQTCPLQGKCRTPNIIYAAEVTPLPVNSTPARQPQSPAHTHNLRRRTTQSQTQTQPIDQNTSTNLNPNTQDTTTVTDTPPRPNYQIMTYIGSTEDFKPRYRNHIKSFNNQIYEKETELSKHIWKLKKNNVNYSINWKIVKRTSGYNPISKTCNLCLAEKVAICNFADKKHLMNKRNELVSKCRHENKYLLANVTDE